MSRLFESDYLYGLHDPGGEQFMLDAGTPGWIVFTEGIGHDSNNRSGADYRAYSNRGLGVIARLNNGYYPEGSIPNSRDYAAFAQRCANFVANSPGCKIWIIGNEMNYAIERPQATTGLAATRSAAPAATVAAPTTVQTAATADDFWSRIVQTVRTLLGVAAPPPASTAPQPTASADSFSPIKPPEDDPYLRALPERFNAINNPVTTERAAASAAQAAQALPQAAAVNGQEVITPALYAQCYRLCRAAIHSVAGHADDQVLIGAVAPWNNQTAYAGNPTGDWIQYFADVLALLGAGGCDGITLHTYTHGADPNLITSEARMNPPFANRHFEFRAYQDFMAAIPVPMRTLPVYITETNEDVVWLDQNIGWVQRAYGEINWWNQQPGNQKIRALVLYRYPPIDRWVIQGKGGVLEDFKMAMQNNYRWPSSVPATIAAGAIVATTDLVNLRRTPGYVNQSSSDVLWQMPNGTQLTVLSGPQNQDGLVWWQVKVNSGSQAGVTGWTAAATGAGQSLLTVIQAGGGDTGGNTGGDFKVGETLQTTTVVRMRRTPGYLNKPATDVVADIPTGSRLTVLSGPQNADGLIWWKLRSVTVATQEGWMAQNRETGEALLTKVSDPGPVDPPTGTFKVGDKVVTSAVVRMRQTPGYNGKAANDVVADIAQGVEGTVQAGPRSADSLTWWQVATTAPNGSRVTGWMAEGAPNGATLLTKATGGTTPPPATTALAAGDIVSATTGLRLRNSPGHLNKAATDVLGDFLAKATINLINGPRTVDNLPWWQVGGILSNGQEAIGWSAQKGVDGATLIDPPSLLPGTAIPNKANKTYLGQPYQGTFGIAQLWGENPQIYRTITYDGIPLIGHNGIDFLTPVGTPILAVDNGMIEQVVYNDPTGFGHFVKVRHGWGEALYAHLSRIDVQVGQQVVRGNVLGATGNTGFVFGPHLHFAIRINPYSRTDGWGGFSDPLPYMNPASITLPSYVRVSGGTRTVAQAVALPSEEAIAQAPGYAPDQPGVTRP